MTTPTQPLNLQDDRWGGYVPWFLRHPDLEHLGQFDLFFSRAAHRLQQLFKYRAEVEDCDLDHLGDAIESNSHQCFRFNSRESLAAQIESFFAPTRIATEATNLTNRDPLVEEASQRYTALLNHLNMKIVEDTSSPLLRMARLQGSPEAMAEAGIRDKIRLARGQVHYNRLVSERLTVLESILRQVQTALKFPDLRTDLRRYLAEAQIMLDIREKPPRIVPMEETLLQKEVIDRLIPRLANRFPQQEKDLVKAYHDLVQGVDTDAVFVLAVKALEEIARKVSGRPKLTLDDHKDLKAAFPDLHPTIHTTILKLAAHRGDKAGHGREGPPPHEMRYLLFSICNVALLFLDYAEPTNPASAS